MSPPSHDVLVMPVTARDHATGPLSAPLILLEYGDFECPHCATAYPIVAELRALFGADLTLVYRNFPLTSVHPHAQRAAETAEWAGQQGRFWEMHDYLFTHQSRLDDRGLAAAASHLHLDPRALQRAWDSHAMIPRIKEDFLGAIQSGVTATPKFYINGQRHDGRATRDELTAALAAAR